MTCARCASDIEADSLFCRRCGAPTGALPAARTRRLGRLPSEGRLGGVCAGLAAYLGVDATIVRLAWVVLTVVPGFIVGGVLAYAVAWLVMPVLDEAPAATGAKRLMRSSVDRKIAGVCGGVAAYFGVDATLVRIAVVVLSIYPGAVICGVLVYLLAWMVMPAEPERALDPLPTAS